MAASELPKFKEGKVYFLRTKTVQKIVKELFTHRPRGTTEGGMLVEPDPENSFLSAVPGAGNDLADPPEQTLPDFEDGKLYLLKESTINKLQALVRKHHCVPRLNGGIIVSEQGEQGTWLSAG